MLPTLIRFSRPLALAALMLLPPAAPAADHAGQIVIGQAIDLSGPNGAIGRDYVAGIKTCFDALNAAGGIGGRRIRYLVRDDHGQPKEATGAVAELIEHDQIDYLFGGVGDDVLQAVLADAAFRRSGLTLFAPLAAVSVPASAPVLFWRPGYQQEISHIFDHFARLGIQDIGVVYQPSPGNAEAYRGLNEEIATRHLHLAATVRIGETARPGPQFAADAARMAAAKPGFVLVIADSIGTALFLKEFRRHRPQTFVAGTSLTNLETLRELAGPAAVEWTVFSQVVPNPASAASPLQNEHLNMMKVYRDESVSALTLEGYAAARSLARALQQAPLAGRTMLRDWRARPREIDLGGLTVGVSGDGNRLSNYLDIALFGKGGKLVF